MDRLSTMDKEEFIARMQGEFRRAMEQVAAAVNEAAEATVTVGLRQLCCRLGIAGRSFARSVKNLHEAARVHLRRRPNAWGWWMARCVCGGTWKGCRCKQWCWTSGISANT